MYKNLNRYDYGIIFLIGLLAFGGLGGAVQPIRLIGISLLPMVLINLISIRLSKNILWVFRFFVFFVFYATLSLFWSLNQNEGLKELIYYLIHFNLFFIIIFWSRKAVNPLKAIIIGWVMVLVATLPIALVEIITSWHLPISRDGSEDLAQIGGVIVKKRFASATFANYNAYVVLLIFCMPFLLAYLKSYKQVKSKLLGWLLLLVMTVVLFINASRGGILCWGILLTVYFLFDRKRIKISMSSMVLGAVVLLTGFYVFNNYATEILQQFSLRMNEGGRSFVEDNARFKLYEMALTLWSDSMFMGTGIGSEIAAMETVSDGITVTHNMYLEVLLQFGLIIFILFMLLLYRIFGPIKRIQLKVSKFILIAFLSVFLPLFIINSGYLLMPGFWVLLASLFVVSHSNMRVDTL